MKAHAPLEILALAHDGGLYGQGVEELVGEHHAAETQRKLTHLDIYRNVAPFGERRRHLAPPRAQFHHREIGGVAHGVCQLADARGHQQAEDGLQLLGGEEIAADAERVLAPPVIAVLRMVQRHLHESPERDRAATGDLVRQHPPRRRHWLDLAWWGGPPGLRPTAWSAFLR